MKIGYRVILSAIGCTVLFLFTEGWEADWKRFDSNVYGDNYYDRGSIIRGSKNIVRVLVKYVPNEKGVMNAVERMGEQFKTLRDSQTLVELECAEKKFRILSVTLYSKEGGILYSEKWEEQESRWVLVTPQSGWGSLHGILCKAKHEDHGLSGPDVQGR